MLKKLIILLIVACIAGIAAADEYEELDSVYCLCQPDSWVTIRFSPKKAYNECGGAYLGMEFKTDWKEKNGFLHIYGFFEAGEGWVAKRYMSIWEPEIYQEGVKTTVAVSKVNCRQTIGGKRRGTLKKGAEVTVWAETPEWCVTNYGYIQTQYLEEIPYEADGSGEESLCPDLSGNRKAGWRRAGLHREEPAKLYAAGSLVQPAGQVSQPESVAVHGRQTDRPGREEDERIESRQIEAA